MPLGNCCEMFHYNESCTNGLHYLGNLFLFFKYESELQSQHWCSMSLSLILSLSLTSSLHICYPVVIYCDSWHVVIHKPKEWFLPDAQRNTERRKNFNKSEDNKVKLRKECSRAFRKESLKNEGETWKRKWWDQWVSF